jgi:hypothetical protein
LKTGDYRVLLPARPYRQQTGGSRLGLFGLFRRPPPVRDLGALADFIDAQAAFVTQKGIYEYARARAGHYAKVLFREPMFLEAVERSRWSAYPIGLAMVVELVEGILRPPRDAERWQAVTVLSEMTLSVFDRYPVPALLGDGAWGEARSELARRLKLIGLHAADPREAARPRFSDHPQLSAGDADQHPRRVQQARGCARFGERVASGVRVLGGAGIVRHHAREAM